MHKKRPILSILILAWNGKDVIETNLNSIFRTMPDDESWEVIVVDNGSTDNTAELVKKYPAVRLFKEKKNYGFAKGNNIGLNKTKGDFILLLNQDVEQIDSAIDKMLDFLRENKEYGLVAPQLLYPGGRIQISCRPFYNWGNLLLDYLTFSRYRKNYYDHSKSQEEDQPMASVLMLKREVLEKVKGFDEHRDFWLYFNDMDLSYRIKKAGFKHYFLAKAKFFHHHGESAFKMLQYKRLWEYHRGLKRFFFKHHIENSCSIKAGFFWIILSLSFIVWNIETFFRGLVKKILKK